MAFKTKNTKLAKLTGYTYEGREISLTRKPGKPSGTQGPRQERVAKHVKDWWPDHKKLEAATVYAVIRSAEQVEQITGIPAVLVKKWSLEPWFDEIVRKVKKEKNEVLDAKITEILDKGLDIVIDRFDNGELYVDRKTKETYRVPVNTKNVGIVIDVLFDKRQLVRGEATNRTETITQDQKLLTLKENFEKLARSKLINPASEIIEAEVITIEQLPEEVMLDAIKQELQEGLQTGSSDGTQSTETVPSGTEQGSERID